jgi:hypothetical protein
MRLEVYGQNEDEKDKAILRLHQYRTVQLAVVKSNGKAFDSGWMLSLSSRTIELYDGFDHRLGFQLDDGAVRLEEG